MVTNLHESKRRLWNVRSAPAEMRFEPLEARRLLAAWSWGPEIGPNEEDVGFYYKVDETGYHWEAEYGEPGGPRRHEYGTLFRAYYDPNANGDASPDIAVYYEQFLARISGEYGWGWLRPVEFSIVEHGDNTFEVIGTPVGWDPQAPPQFGPSQIGPTLPRDASDVELIWFGLLDRNPDDGMALDASAQGAPPPVVSAGIISLDAPAPVNQVPPSPLSAMADDLLFTSDEAANLLG